MAIALPGGCRVFGLTEGEPEKLSGGKVWRHVGRERGAEAVSLSVLELAPGASASWRNGDCDDVLFVLSGEGAISLGSTTLPIRPDTGIYVRPGERVSLRCSVGQAM